MYNEPSSPLEHSRDSIDKLLFCADTGIPSIYSPAPLAGATAPITTAGHVAQGLAEALFGLVLHQLRRPGAPIVLGMGPAVLDMATAQSSYNAPEYLRSYACIVEMVKWLDLPNWGYGGTSDAQLVDAQAGMEAAELTLLSLLLGSNLNHDVGYLDFGLSGSFEQIVIVAEYIALNRRLLGGIVVDKETLALDVIADAGPGGNFLGKRHTAKHLRGTQWRPQVFNRLGRERWLEEGGLDLRERARRRALALLAAHQPPPLPQATTARIDELIDAYVPEV
jgi:trimethylamine--corrinoid protein Co-methyltransferase